jgi:F-type H+-transporting ATPase subunit epsilon
VHVELVSPERILFSGEAEMVVCRTLDGEVAFLANHAPLLAALEIAAVRVLRAEGPEERAAVHGGFVQVHNNEVTILSDVAEPAGEIDVERAQRARDEAERRFQETGDTESEDALRRAQVRLELAAAG